MKPDLATARLAAPETAAAVPRGKESVMNQAVMGQAKWILITLIAIGGLAILLGVASQAIWTDTDAVSSNDFATGTLSLTATDSPSPMWNVTAGTPGARETGSVTVTNAGTMELRYAVTGSNVGDAALPAAMNLRIGLRGGAGCDFPYHNADGTATTLTDDTQLIATTLNTTALIGNPAQGPDAGDRTLTTASPTEVLCFAVVLPDTAGNPLQGLNTTTTFTFDSEQTANNP